MTPDTIAHTPTGEPIQVFTLLNTEGSRVRLLSWGAALIEMSVPDREGKLADITLGFDDPHAYLEPHPFFGAIAGRFANRIAGGQFTLDGKTYTLARNNGANHLHGGLRGFDKQNWTSEILGENEVRFTLESPDGDEGYPGKLTARVTYTLTDADELRLDCEATTDAPTVLNLTNHTFWNLDGSADVLGHELQLFASNYVVVDEASIPTGEVRAVQGSVMDFTSAKAIGRDIASVGVGYDHNWVIDPSPAPGLAPAAELYSPLSGRVLRVATDLPGIQFYSGNYLDGLTGRGGKAYGKRAGLCLETQHFPDAPNRPAFPSCALRPGETFRSTTEFAAGVR